MERAVDVDYVPDLTFVIKSKRDNSDLNDFVLGFVQTRGLSVDDCSNERESGSRRIANVTRLNLSQYSVSSRHFQMLS